jgi:hypothetical protein
MLVYEHKESAQDRFLEETAIRERGGDRNQEKRRGRESGGARQKRWKQRSL